MKYITSKDFTKDGKNFTIKATFRLSDDCKNGVCDFDITADIYNQVGTHVSGGCIHEEIVKYFPELRPFISLHLSNEFGQRMYPVDNFIYHIQHGMPTQELIGTYGVTSNQLAALKEAVCDKDYFRYMLFHTGVVSQWREEAERAIQWLEEKTGETFVHTQNPRFTLCQDEEFDKAMKARIDAGEFTPQAIEERRQEAHKEWQRKEYARIQKEYDLSRSFIERRKEIAEWIVDNTPTTNYSFFAYKGFLNVENPTYKLTINEYGWKPTISKSSFDEFVKRDDIPQGLTIEFKEN